LLDNFDDRYLGAKASAPSVDNDGNALIVGALYFDTTQGKMFVYTTSGWLAASSASVATLATFEFVATAGQTVFSGNDVNGVLLSYTAPALMISLNGVALRPGDDFTATNGTSITLTSAASLNDELVVYAFGSFVIADTYSVTAADAQFLPKVNPSYTGTLTGGTGVMNFGSGQFYKDASGNVGIGTSSPQQRLDVTGGYLQLRDSTGSGGYRLTIGADSTSCRLNSVDNTPLTFSMGGSEKARIDSSGSLLVGKTTNSLAVKGWVLEGGTALGFGSTAFDMAGTTNECFNYNNTGTGTYDISFRYQNSAKGYIRCSSTAVAYTNLSDYRLKEDVQPMTGALAKVALLKPCTYKWKVDGSSAQGFIAHELQEVVPDAVTGEKDAVKEDGTPYYQGVDTSFLVATLTAAIQEQQVLINTQQAALTALTARIEALEN
jgi:hypothetical protein